MVVPPRSQEPTVGPSHDSVIDWRFVVPAVILGMLSTISKADFCGVELSGGVTLGWFAIIVFLLPVIRQLAMRGGRAELFGLKLHIEKLDRKGEEDYATRLQELRTDLEELRANVSPPEEGRRQPPPPTATEEVEEAFFEAVKEYRRYSGVGEWRGRNAVDQQLVARRTWIPVERLKNIVAHNRTDQDVATAAAVILGQIHTSDDEMEAVQLLVELLDSPFERVRYRAARSVERRGRRSDTSRAAWELLTTAIRNRLRKERGQTTIGALQDADRALLTLRYSVR